MRSRLNDVYLLISRRGLSGAYLISTSIDVEQVTGWNYTEVSYVELRERTQMALLSARRNSGQSGLWLDLGPSKEPKH